MKILENKLSININNNHRLYLTVHCLHTITNSYYKTKHFQLVGFFSTFQVRLDFKFYILFLSLSNTRQQGRHAQAWKWPHLLNYDKKNIILDLLKILNKPCPCRPCCRVFLIILFVFIYLYLPSYPLPSPHPLSSTYLLPCLPILVPLTHNLY